MNKNHYIWVAALALVAGFIGGTLSSKLFTPGPKDSREDGNFNRVIVASEIHLVDAETKDRWVLKLSKDGEPDMTFISKNGWAPMGLGLNRTGHPYFSMVPESGKGGGPCLALLDREMRNRAVLGLREDGIPYLSLIDPNGQVRANLGGMDFKNPLTGMGEKRPPSSLLLFGETGEILFSAPELGFLPVKAAGYLGAK